MGINSLETALPPYIPDANGYVNMRDVSWMVFDAPLRQKAPYIHGEVDKGYPNLGRDLRFIDDLQDDLQQVKIHSDDIDELSDRVQAFEMLRNGLVRTEQGTLRMLTTEEVDSAYERLTSTGLSMEELETALHNNKALRPKSLRLAALVDVVFCHS